MTPQQIEALNIAGQCRATASSPLAKNILVDEGNGLLTELLLDAARIIEALAQPEQEPVAWMKKMFSPELGEFFDYKDGAFAKETDCQGWTPLYTTPPQRTWVGLTEQEHTDIAVECGCMSADWVFYGAAVERKVKEKNT